MPKILIVEDDRDSRTMLDRCLQSQGYQTVLASDGEEGLELLLAERPDAIILDLNMPGVDGWEVTRQIKAMPDLAGVPVIALSGHSLPEDETRAVEAGCSIFHSKPVDLTLLVTQLEDQLREHFDSSADHDAA